jgi:hypothetical protein
VAGNTVRNATKGTALVQDLRGNEVRDNSVEASEIAYSIEDSLGDNKAGNNRIVGRPTSPWKTSRLKASDVVEP